MPVAGLPPEVFSTAPQRKRVGVRGFGDLGGDFAMNPLVPKAGAALLQKSNYQKEPISRVDASPKKRYYILCYTLKLMANTETKWAVIELGGKQHLVLAGNKIEVNRLENKVGETITLKSLLDQTPVTLKVTEELRGEKIHGLKFKNKVRYIRHYGHRQNLSALEVISIGESAKKVESKAAEKPVVTKKEAKTPTAKKPAVKKAAPKKAAK